MTDRYWKSRSLSWRREGVVRPSAGQLTRQAGLIFLVLLVWGGLLAGYLQLTETPTSRPDEVASNAASPGPPAQATALPSPTATTPPPTAVPPATTTPAAQNPDQAAGPTSTLPASPTPAPPPPPPTDTPAPAPPPDAPAGVSFKADVLPILERRCVKCHGGEKTEEGLVLKSHAEVLAGSWNGPVVEPGNAAESYLVELITTGKMPNKEPRLLPGEIRAITEWIEAGAPDN